MSGIPTNKDVENAIEALSQAIYNDALTVQFKNNITIEEILKYYDADNALRHGLMRLLEKHKLTEPALDETDPWQRHDFLMFHRHPPATWVAEDFNGL